MKFDSWEELKTYNNNMAKKDETQFKNDDLLKHINEIIGIIQNDCIIMLDRNTYSSVDRYTEVMELHKGIAHIQGLCNGIKKHIDYKFSKEEL